MKPQMTLALAFVVGCGGKTEAIDDPQMQATAAQVGEQSAETAQMDPEADDSTIQGQITALGSSFQSIVGQHQAYAGTARAALPVGQAGPPNPDIAEGEVSWDGEHLLANWTYDQGGVALTYLVDLDFTNGGIDGGYYLEYVIGVAGVGTRYKIDVTYDNLTTDGGSCITGGVLTIEYDLSVDAGGLGGLAGGVDQSGTIIATYSGCNEVALEGA